MQQGERGREAESGERSTHRREGNAVVSCVVAVLGTPGQRDVVVLAVLATQGGVGSGSRGRVRPQCVVTEGGSKEGGTSGVRGACYSNREGSAPAWL